MDSLTLAATAALYGRSSTDLSLSSGTVSVTGRSSVFWVRVAAPSPGKCFTVPAQLGHLGRVAAERAAELVDEVPRGAIHVEHGREVDIEADTAQVVRAQAALSGRLGPRVSGLADLLRRQDRLPRQPLDLAALLVRHEQQRLAHRVARAGVGALELLDDRREVRPGADVAGEEDDPGYLAVPDQLEQAGRRGEAGVAVDHALAGQLSHGELRQHD